MASDKQRERIETLRYKVLVILERMGLDMDGRHFALSAGMQTHAELLTEHPHIARRTAQRLIARLIESGQIIPRGEGRARSCFGAGTQTSAGTLTARSDGFPCFIALSADSQDILAYVDQPLEARKPVGYQRDFLEAYRPNETGYLSESLCRQLHRMGKTADIDAPAGTYSRAILNRLLIDLSWASSHLEGNTYSRLDTRELIEHGKAARGKAAIETQMILNHKTAIELLVENIGSAEFNRYTVMNLHSALAENLLPNPADEGRIRQHAVDIGKSVYRPLSTPQQIEDALLDKASRTTRRRPSSPPPEPPLPRYPGTRRNPVPRPKWIPAFAGMTGVSVV